MALSARFVRQTRWSPFTVTQQPDRVRRIGISARPRAVRSQCVRPPATLLGLLTDHLVAGITASAIEIAVAVFALATAMAIVAIL